jgi:hypothetical protein
MAPVALITAVEICIRESLCPMELWNLLAAGVSIAAGQARSNRLSRFCAAGRLLGSPALRRKCRPLTCSPEIALQSPISFLQRAKAQATSLAPSSPGSHRRRLVTFNLVMVN